MQETQQLKSIPLPVTKIIKEVNKFPFNQTQAFWVWMVTLCFISFGISQAETYFILPTFRDPPFKNGFGLKAVLNGLGQGLVFTLLAIICNRMILLEEKLERWVDFYRWSRRETWFLSLVFLLYAVALMVNFIPILTHFLLYGDSFPSLIHFKSEGPINIKFIVFMYAIGIPLTLFFLLLYVLSRVVLILPATAIDESPTLAWAWNRSRGNGWRLTLMILIPCIYASFLVALGKDLEDVITPSLLWIPEILQSVAYVVWAMLEAVLLSEVYKELRSEH